MDVGPTRASPPRLDRTYGLIRPVFHLKPLLTKALCQL
jgi:hypothetical protein